MRFFRSERVQKLILEELSKLVIREVEFSEALVTLTRVEVDKKLEHAKVMVSVLPSERGAYVLETLASRAGHLQHLLNKKMNIRPMPKIVFELDHGTENAATVEKILLDQ